MPDNDLKDIPTPAPVPLPDIPGVGNLFPKVQVNGIDPNQSPEANAFSRFTSFFAGSTPDSRPSLTSKVEIAPSRIDQSGRYPFQFPGLDNEDIYAQNQGSLEKFSNSLIKMGGIAGTTVLSGTAGLINGMGEWAKTGQFSTMYDNDFTKGLDQINKNLENQFPAYYTAKERAADWYEPESLFTANFWFDKVVKNLGFAIGAFVPAAGISKGLQAISLSSKLFAAGEALAAVEAIEAISTAVPRVNQLSRMSSALSSLANSSKGVAGAALKGLGAAEGEGLLVRSIASAISASGESSLEAYQNLNEFRSNLIADYQTTHGYAPTGTALEEINAASQGVGNKSFLLNMALLSGTEFIQLPKIMSSTYRGEKNLLNDIIKNEKTGIYEAVAPTRFGRITRGAKGIATLLFNPAEGFEEGAQYAIQTGTQDYYNKKYRGEDSDFLSSAITGLGEGFFSKEGLENVFIGGVSGAAMTARNTFREQGFLGNNKQRQANTEAALRDFNDTKYTFTRYLKDGVDEANRAITIQEQREAAIRQGDILESKDLEFDYSHNYLSNRIKWGRYDLVTQDINDTRTLASTQGGFEQLQQEGRASQMDTQATFLERLNNFQDHANQVKESQENLNTKYGNNPYFSPEVIDKMVYAHSKIFDYDKRIPQLVQPLTAAGIATFPILDSIINSGTPSEQATKDAINQINNLNTTSEVKDDLKQSLQDVVEISLRRKQFIKQYDDIKANPQAHKETETTPKTKTATVKVKTKDGEEELDVDEEYYLGKVTEYDSKGNAVFRFPRIKILGENSNGTIKIQTSNGSVRDISKAELESYKLGKVSDVKNNKKANFYLEHINDIFEFNFGKGKKQKGRLEFHPKEGTMHFVYKDSKGRIKSVEVTGDQFVAKKGFKNPMISKVGTLSTSQQKALEDFSAQQDNRVEEKRRARLGIIESLVNNTGNRLTSVQELLQKKYSELETVTSELYKLEQRIKGGELTKRNNFKATTNRAIKAANRLSRLQEDLTREIQELEGEQEELELNLEYFYDLASNIDELPTNSQDFIDELKEQTSDLENLILETGNSINKVSSLLDKVQGALDTSIALVRDAISSFEKNYPKAPTSIDNQEFIDFLQANPNFLKIKENYKEDLKTLEEFIAQVEDLDITPNERTLSELRAQLEGLQIDLQELENQYKAKSAILDRFNSIAEQYKKEQAELEALRKSQEYKDAIFKTQEKTGENAPSDARSFEAEPKKADNIIYASTVVPGEGQTLQPHHLRANFFGSIFSTLKGKESYKAIIITENMGEPYASIIKLAKGDYQPKNQNDEPILALFVKETSPGQYSYINQSGETLSKLGDTISPDEAVFQTLPRPTLETTGGFQRGRNTSTQEDLNHYREQYKAQRNKWLTSPSILDRVQSIAPSFGFIKEEFRTSTPQPASNIVSQEQITSQPLIILSTQESETVSNNFQTIKVPKGVPTLNTGNYLTPLNNRKLSTEEKATLKSILSALSSMSKEQLRSETASKLFTYLRGVVYWGIPADQAGRNAIWFSPEGYLHFGNNEARIPFTPSAIQESPLLNTFLNEMYNNTNSLYLSQNEPFFEAQAVDESGNITQQKRWNTYQEYLLSNEGRTSEQIPLTISAPPSIAEDGIQTREGIYFTLENLESGYTRPEPKQEAPATPQPKRPSVKPEKELTPATQALLSMMGVKAPVTTGEHKGEIESVIGGIGADLAKGAFIRVQEEIERGIYWTQTEESAKSVLSKLPKGYKIESKSKTITPANKAPFDVDGFTIIKDENKSSLNPIAEMLAKMAEGKPTGLAAGVAGKFKPKGRGGQTRIVTSNSVPTENWKKVEAFLKKNLPGVPVYRVKNIIQVTENTQAWGLFADGAIYLYENAEFGTAYHEVFHSIMFHFASQEEKENLLKEFQGRKGRFTPRGSTQSMWYSEADYSQMEEELAEEFRDYVISDGEKSIIGKIGDFFRELYNFIFGVRDNIQGINQLFKGINQGKYRYYTTDLTGLSYAEQGLMNVDYISTDDFGIFEMREKINAIEEKDLLNHMTSQAFQYLFSEAKNLFNFQTIKKDEFYDKIYDYTLSTLISDPYVDLKEQFSQGTVSQVEFDIESSKLDKLAAKIIDNWVEIQDQHELYMKTFSIEFDENDDIVNKDENKTGRETGQEAMQVDHIRKANSAIKLLFASLYEVVADRSNFSDVLANVTPSNSSIGGDQLLSFGKSFVTTLNNLADSPSFDKMIDNLVNQATNNPDYVNLFRRLKGSRTSGKIMWDTLDINDLRLLIAFFKTFSKQQPEVVNHYLAEDGSAYIGSGNLANASETLREGYEQSLIRTAKKSSLFTKTKVGDTQGYKASPEVKKWNINSDENKIKFLKELGIDIQFNKLNTADKNIVRGAVNGIHTALVKSSILVSLNGKTFDIQGRLSEIAETQAKLTQTQGDSTFFNINGELQQTYVEKNYPSKFAEVINSLPNKQALTNTNFSYLLTDVFSRNSVVMNKVFPDGTTPQSKIRLGYINGTINLGNNKRTSTDRLPLGTRLTQQINLALNGWYYTLLPADSSTEWMLNLGKFITFTDIRNDNKEPLYNIFKGYLQDEIDLAKEDRQHNIYVATRSKKLRFLQDILGDTLSKKAVDSTDFEEFYTANQAPINAAIDAFLQSNSKVIQDELTSYNIVSKNKEGNFEYPALDTKGISSFNKDGFTQETFDKLTEFIASNYMIANIEMHKTIFGDPYEYKDELKRIKSFLSPAETTISSTPEINNFLNEEYNQSLEPTDPGYRTFTDRVRTIAFQDVEVSSELYKDPFVEPDAQGLITDSANREFRIKTTLWSDLDENQYQYDKAWERHQKAGKNPLFNIPTTEVYTYSSPELERRDEEILKKGNPLSPTAYYITKPIVRGNKYSQNINAVLIDKFSLAPLSYRALMEFNSNSNMVRLYNKMNSEGIDYAVFESARKVGNAGNNTPYKEGKINTEPFKNVVDVPFENFSIQVQTTPKIEASQTLGSQLTKLATLNLMAAGVPLDYKGEDWYSLSEEDKLKSPLYKEIKHNQAILEAMINNGYQTLLNKIGVEDTGTTFKIKDREKVAKTLKGEILKREVNENVIKSLDYFAKGTIALESTPVYQQFKNILYSIVDKNITSPKVSGGPKVQMASTFFEDERIIRTDHKGKITYTSTNLEFYENKDGKRRMEVYISSSYIRQQFSPNHPVQRLTDEELFSQLTQDELGGIGFRIPSQNTNSADVFIIKKFLPREMGDTVVVPSELVKKSGSDFDIDKLNTYLKNMYYVDGKVTAIPYLGINKEDYSKLATSIQAARKVTPDEDAIDTLDFSEEPDLSDLDRLYSKALQNEYYDSLKRLLSNPLIFDRLVEPNDAGPLKTIAQEVAKLKGLPKDNAPITSFLNPIYMNRMRHNFVIGKYAVGIAAVQQTNHAQNQRSQMYIDVDRLKKIPKDMQEFLGNCQVLLKHNSKIINGKRRISLSEIKDQSDEFISDIISMYIDGYVDIAKGAWIIDMGATPNVASTFMFLHKIGVPKETVIYFMNQPIIQDYLKSIEQAGYSWLFIDDFATDLKASKYATKSKIPTTINEKALKGNIGNQALTDPQKAEQQLILSEFLKYAKMAQHLFHVTQGSNYDTASFNDPYLLFKKEAQLGKARNTIISSVNNILDDSFVGEVKDSLEASRNAISLFLPTDSPRIRGIIEKTLTQYTDLPDRQYIKAAKGVVQSFLDYVIQTSTRLNTRISELMVSDKNIPSQVRQIIDSLPQDSEIRDNPVIAALLTLESQKENTTNNLKLTTKNAEVYDQNNLIKAFQEVKENPYFKDIYPNILRVSLLQGLANSPISFTQFLPVEDMVNAMQPIISKLESLPGLEAFSDLNMFERNNWSNPDIVPSAKQWKKNDYGVLKIYSKVKPLKAFRQLGGDVIGIDSLSRVTNQDVITITYNKSSDAEGKPYTKARIEEMKKAGDYSYLFKGLYKKVYQPSGEELYSSYSITDPETKEVTREGRTLYFRQINAWGDSYRLQEYYNNPQQSVVDNSYTKVSNELSDEIVGREINPRLYRNIPQNTLSSPIEPEEGTEGICVGNFPQKH